jgi:hypothetical protein
MKKSSFALAVLLISLLLTGCGSTDDDAEADPGTAPTESASSAPDMPEGASSAPPDTSASTLAITNDDVHAVLNNVDTSETNRSFAFETKAYETTGTFLVFGKQDVSVKGNGTITLKVSSTRNVVIDTDDKTIRISFGKTDATATTNVPEQWEFVAADDKEQSSVDKNKEKYAASFTSDKSLWDEDSTQSIREEIDSQKDEAMASEKTKLEDEVRVQVESILNAKYDLSDYTIKIIFDK